MNFIERWLLRRFLKKMVIQGFHQERMEVIFKEIISAWEAEFYEDNHATTKHILREIMNNALDDINKEKLQKIADFCCKHDCRIVGGLGFKYND